MHLLLKILNWLTMSCMYTYSQISSWLTCNILLIQSNFYKDQCCSSCTYLGKLRLKLLLRCVKRMESRISSDGEGEPFLAMHGAVAPEVEWNDSFCWNLAEDRNCKITTEEVKQSSETPYYTPFDTTNTKQLTTLVTTNTSRLKAHTHCTI